MDASLSGGELKRIEIATIIARNTPHSNLARVDLPPPLGPVMAIKAWSPKVRLTSLMISLSGRILFNGRDITKMNITQRADLGISFAFQQPVRFKGLKVKDLITLAAGSKVKLSGACDYLSKVGLCARDCVCV